MQYISNFLFMFFSNIVQFININFIFFDKILKEVFITSLHRDYNTTIAKVIYTTLQEEEKRVWYLDNMRFCLSSAFSFTSH